MADKTFAALVKLSLMTDIEAGCDSGKAAIRERLRFGTALPSAGAEGNDV
jgi:hypothetical protein